VLRAEHPQEPVLLIAVCWLQELSDIITFLRNR
jgi:hypothetical protein